MGRMSGINIAVKARSLHHMEGKQMMGPRRIKRVLHYSLTQEQGRMVAQCLEIDVASDGVSAHEAYASLSEALELYAEHEDWSSMLFPLDPIAFTGE